MTTLRCDFRALSVALELHREEEPEITILFGSGARGDYQDGRSDIDVMIVQQILPSREQRARTDESARTSVELIYGEYVLVQVVWQTTERFGRMRRTINDVVAGALRHGIIMSRNPENPDLKRSQDHDYEWVVTDWRRHLAEEYLESFHEMADQNRDDMIIGQMASCGLDQSLKALISANRKKYPLTGDVNRLFQSAREADTGFMCRQFIDGRIYDQYPRSQEYDAQARITDIPDYRDLVHAEVRAILDRVLELWPSSI